MGPCGKCFSGLPPLNALVLDAGSRAAVETIQSLARRGVQVDAAANGHCLAFSSKRLRRRLHQPAGNQQRHFLDWLMQLDREVGYSLIVPSTEISLRNLLSLAESDPLRQKALLSSNASMRIALDKYLTLQFALKLHIPVPETILIDSRDAIPISDPYPVVLKPVSSLVPMSGDAKPVYPRIVRNDFERREVLEDMLGDSPVLHQQFVPGRGVGIEMLYRHGRPLWYFSHERLHEGSGLLGLGGASSYRQSVTPNQELLRHAVTLLNALEWHGVAMVEYRVAENGCFWLMEINPRLWGSLALSLDAGVDFPYGLLCLATGNEVPPQPVYRIGHRTRLLWSDLEWLKNRMSFRLDGYIAFEILKLFGPLGGHESWDYFDWGDLSITIADFRCYARRKFNSIKHRVAEIRQRTAARKLHEANVRHMLAVQEKPRNILFLCYGNICRSVVAEFLMRLRHPAFQVHSAGFHRNVGRASPPYIQAAANAFSIDLSNHLSRRVTLDMVRDADVVFIHDMWNYHDFCHEFPQDKKKVLFLGLFLRPPLLEIHDPYDLDSARTAEVVKQVSDAIDFVGAAFESTQD